MDYVINLIDTITKLGKKKIILDNSQQRKKKIYILKNKRIKFIEGHTERHFHICDINKKTLFNMMQGHKLQKSH